MKNKFSKKMLAEYVWDQINKLEKQYGFKSYDGWHQVKGKGEEINRAYGEYDSLFSLINEFDLSA